MWFCSVLIFNFNFCVHCQNAVCVCVRVSISKLLFFLKRKGSSLLCHIIVCMLHFKF